jgi:hypothetical protein
MPTFCITDGSLFGKYQGLKPAHNALRFDTKEARNLPLIIQFTVGSNQT